VLSVADSSEGFGTLRKRGQNAAWTQRIGPAAIGPSGFREANSVLVADPPKIPRGPVSDFARYTGSLG
jgi:hypothetical protein